MVTLGELTHYIELYVEEEVFPEMVDTFKVDLESNIKRETPIKEGRLQRSIRVDSRIYQDYAMITGYWDEELAPHGIFVLAGSSAVDGKLMRMPWGYRTKRRAIPPNDFLGRGLENTIRLYK